MIRPLSITAYFLDALDIKKPNDLPSKAYLILDLNSLLFYYGRLSGRRNALLEVKTQNKNIRWLASVASFNVYCSPNIILKFANILTV